MKLDLNKNCDCFFSMALVFVVAAVLYYYYYEQPATNTNTNTNTDAKMDTNEVPEQVGGSSFGYPIPRDILSQSLLRGPYRTWTAFHYPYQSPWGFYQSPWLYYQQPWLLDKFDYFRSTVPTYYSRFSYTYNNAVPSVNY